MAAAIVIEEEQIMAVAYAKIHYLDQIYSPFSGLPADGESGPNESDPTLLFVYYGNAGDFAYILQQRRNEISGRRRAARKCCLIVSVRHGSISHDQVKEWE